MKQGKSFQESHDITMNKVGAGIISPHAEHNIKAFFDGIGKPSPYAENYKRYIQGSNLSAPRGGNVFEDFLGSYFSGKLFGWLRFIWGLNYSAQLFNNNVTQDVSWQLRILFVVFSKRPPLICIYPTSETYASTI